MADGLTSNFALVVPQVGGDVGSWGGIINTSLITLLDTIMGAVTPVTMTSSNVVLTLSQWQTGTRFKITGALTANLTLSLPRTDATSPDAGAHAVGGAFIVDNETTNTGGPWTITVLTTVGGSTGVTVAQGSRTSLYSDGTNVFYADDSRTAKLSTNAGNPNGSVSGNAGAVNQPADVVWDRTNQVLYVSTGGTSWVSLGQSLPNPQGYLTPTSGVPIITGDVAGATTVYYTPYRGNQVPIYNGTTFLVFAVPEIAIGITGATASSIYDFFVGVVGGVPVAGWGPAWTVGGGSVTAGSCSRGTGAGSTALQRLNGILTNQFSMSLTNAGGAGSPPYAISANQGTYVGSMFVDTSTSQVSLLRSWGGGTAGGPGTARKWGLWNPYNRAPILMQCGDNSTPSITQNAGAANAWAQVNVALNPNSNLIQTFTGLAEEALDLNYHQVVGFQNGNGPLSAIGFNSATAPSGFYSPTPPIAIVGTIVPLHATSFQPPSLGVNIVYPLINTQGAQLQRIYTGSNAMMLTSRYNG